MSETPQDNQGTAGAADNHYDAIVVGAGFSGIYMLKTLRDRGMKARLLEAGDGIGGTWFWNRYPGARCDVESLAYSYSFDEDLQQEWEWSERYPAQPELLTYINHVADRFELWDDIQLETRVATATYDDGSGRWAIVTEAGESFDAHYCVMATGCLNVEKLPEIKGVKSFDGIWYHTSNWPKEPVDFEGKRVGVIGTGSTGIQLIPEVAKDAEHLYVFQRTPNFSYPGRNRPLEPDYVRQVKSGYADYRQRARVSPVGSIPLVPPPRERLPSAAAVAEPERREHLEVLWEWGHAPSFMASFQDVLINRESNDLIADFFREKIAEKVDDPDLAEKLMPRGYAVGTRRMCLDNGYFETYNRDNVTLVDLLQSPIEEIVTTGVKTTQHDYELDVLVLATGFDAMTGSLLAVDIRGKDGLSLRAEWKDGPRTYLGLQIAGFPNLFTITGPQSPSVLTNMVMSIEQHVEWIGDTVDYMRAAGVERIEATPEAQEAWVEHANEIASKTLFNSDVNAKSWYMGSNIQGKPVGLMPYVGGTFLYKQKLDGATEDGYAGFELS